MRGTTRYAVTLAVTVLATALVGGCANVDMEPKQAAPARAGATATYGPNVVHLDGLRDIRFGQSSTDLTSRGSVNVSDQACGPRFTDIGEVTPVFAEGVLVLMWFNPPFATPEGVLVGTPVDDVRVRYGNEVELTPPAGSYTFPGLLVREGDRAYLFLHDGKTVQKAVAGYESYVRKLYDTGFGSC
jgi:hypothetical protein